MATPKSSARRYEGTGGELAIEGGSPVRKTLLPYGRQSISPADIEAVTQVLKSDWLTTGPKVAEFEKAVSHFCGAADGIAVNSGTAALHVAVASLGLSPGDEVIVPPMTFAATSNAVLYCGGKPVFADVDPQTLLLDPKVVEKKITSRTRAIIAVDYAGQPCDYAALRRISQTRGLRLIADASHSLGATFTDKRVGSLADMTTLSFHPVKHITTGEGGMVLGLTSEYSGRMRAFRNHGINSSVAERESRGTWFYEMKELGFNYRLSDIQSALGLSQLTRLPAWITPSSGARREVLQRLFYVRYSDPIVRIAAGIACLPSLRGATRAGKTPRKPRLRLSSA